MPAESGQNLDQKDFFFNYFSTDYFQKRENQQATKLKDKNAHEISKFFLVSNKEI